jgi:DNA-binding transcriptional LysR family regulator
MIRVSQAKMALEHVLELDGAAYLPVRMLTAHLEAERLHLVRNAPTISRRAYAVFPLRSEKLELIEEVFDYFEYSVELDPLLL